MPDLLPVSLAVDKGVADRVVLPVDLARERGVSDPSEALRVVGAGGWLDRSLPRRLVHWMRRGMDGPWEELAILT